MLTLGRAFAIPPTSPGRNRPALPRAEHRLIACFRMMPYRPRPFKEASVKLHDAVRSLSALQCGTFHFCSFSWLSANFLQVSGPSLLLAVNGNISSADLILNNPAQRHPQSVHNRRVEIRNCIQGGDSCRGYSELELLRETPFLSPRRVVSPHSLPGRISPRGRPLIIQRITLGDKANGNGPGRVATWATSNAQMWVFPLICLPACYQRVIGI